MSSPVLRIADLRTVLGLALDAFETEHGQEMAVEHDYYWHLPVDAAFDLSREPAELTVGQLSDDLVEINGFVSEGDARPAWHSISHAIGLLRLLEHAARP